MKVSQSPSMELSDCPISLSSLFCPEDGSFIAVDEVGDDLDELFMFCKSAPLFQLEEEYIENLVSKESSLLSVCLSSSRRYLLCGRSESIRWILKMKSSFGFSLLTAYLAVTYVDRFLLRRNLEEGRTWATKLLSIACLSLAAKMEECSPPLLSKYCFEECRFSSEVMLRMELLVLATLEWRLSSVTPFTFLSYFASKFNFEHRSKNLYSRAISLIFGILEATSLLDHRPSAIAAAAILAASGDSLTKKSLESKMAGVSLSESLESGQVFSCYNAMIHESKQENVRSRKVSSSLNGAENSISCSSSATSNKRRRLLTSD